MRKITKEIVAAFMNHETKRIGNSYTDGTTLFLHGNAIARHDEQDGWIEISTAGYPTRTTLERLNGIGGFKVFQRDYEIYLDNGFITVRWDGQWTSVYIH